MTTVQETDPGTAHPAGDVRRPARCKLVVLLACYNRRDLTLRCLRSLQDQHHCVHRDVEVVLVDDASTDGTAQAVAEEFPDVHIVRGDGTLFWARSMEVAERTARRLDPDGVVWLNDDVELESDVIDRLWDTHRQFPEAIIVGATVDPASGERSYGGKYRIGRHPQRFSPAPLSLSPLPVDTFNGNVVLVPREIQERIGPIDGGFAQAYADEDYGLRARKIGIPTIQMAGIAGRCAANLTQSIQGMTAKERWKWLRSRKGMPVASQVIFLSRHGGPEWPLYLVYQYARRLLSDRD